MAATTKETKTARRPCRLRLRALPLLNSHVIPEWLYEPLYDELHRYLVIQAGERQGKTLRQRGVRERMLCQSCETDVSVYEDYARRALVGGANIQIRKVSAGIEVRGLDYAMFKLFQLSVLWRSGVALSSFFSAVDLGGHSEPLRQMLRARNPGAAADYGCIMLAVVAEDQLLTDLITQPISQIVNGSPMVRMIFGGLAWLFVLGPDESHPFVKLFLDPAGILEIRLGGKAIEGYLRRLAATFVPETI